MDARKSLGEGFVVDYVAVDANALVDSFEVGRSVQASAKTSLAKDGFEKRCRGAFAVGTGDVDAGIGALRLAQSLGEHRDVFEVKLCRRGLRRGGQFATERKQVADRGFVVHLSSRANQGSWR